MGRSSLINGNGTVKKSSPCKFPLPTVTISSESDDDGDKDSAGDGDGDGATNGNATLRQVILLFRCF